MAKAVKLGGEKVLKEKLPTFGVFATGDPRVSATDRVRCVNIVEMTADVIAAGVRTADGQSVNVVWSPVLVDGEKQADIVGRQFAAAGVDAVVCAPDTWPSRN